MKKQEMIEVIEQEKDILWNEFIEMLNEFGIDHSGTEAAGIRFATITQLALKLGIR